MALSKAEKLPQEIIFDILSRLPAKTIGQFRCVSKHWCSLLSNPLFIQTHLIHSRKQQEKLIVICEASTLHSITFNQNENGILSKELNFRQLSDSWITIGGSCNGLVLVVTKDDVKFLINPTTLKYHRIPDFHMALPMQDSFIMYGLGYDFVSDDYKMVTLSYYNTENDCGPDIFDTFVDVYSARNRTWKRFGSSPYIHQIPRLASGVLVNGALHWLASNNTSCVIAAFDLSDEKFLEVPAPSVFDEVSFVFNKLVALRGCLCMFTDNINRDGIDVWMMKDYGVKESWTKFEVIGLDSVGDLIPLCLISEDDVVLDADGELIVYHTREDQWSLMVDGIPTLGEDTGTGTFRETLVSPTFGCGA